MSFRKVALAGVSLLTLQVAMSGSAAACDNPETQDRFNESCSFTDIMNYTNPGFDIFDTNDPGVEIDNVGHFLNEGSIRSTNDYGVLINGSVVGSFTNALGADIVGASGGVYIGDNMTGDFVNHGDITGSDEGGVIIDANLAADFNNTGNIAGGSYGVYIADNMSGDFATSGSISGTSYGVYIGDELNGNFTNTGEIAGGSYGVAFEENMVGNFTNTGNITGGDESAVHFDNNLVGSFSNTGNLTGGSYGVYIDSNLAGDFSSSGSISGTSYGVYIGDNLSGNFTNTGNITSTGEAALYIDDNLAGSFTNTGNLTGVSYGVLISGNVAGDFTNTGNITATGEAAVMISHNLVGDFTNTGDLTGGSYGVFISGNMSGDFTNTGDISGSEYGVNISNNLVGDFTNTGNIAGASGYGVKISGNMIGDFTNTGDIRTSYEAAVYISNNLTGNFTNTGVIAGGSYGVFLGDNMTGDFFNTGNISGLNYGVFIDENLVGDFTNTGNVSGGETGVFIEENMVGDFTNTGNIVGTVSYGVFIWENLTGDFTNTGNISSTGEGGVFVSANMAGDFTNTGNISGGSYGVFIGDNLSGDFTNKGEITGTAYGVNISNNLVGDFTNTGDIAGGSIGVRIGDNMVGDFTTDSSITGTEYGIYIGSNLTGDFTNKGEILASNSAALYIDGSLTGTFKNTGDMSSASTYAVYINGNLGGDFINTGNMSSGGGIPSAFDGEYVAYIDGNFAGNFTSTVGQGIIVDDHADIRGQTVTAWFNRFIADGYTWVAISADTLSNDNPLRLQDNSALYDVTWEVDDDDLILEAHRNNIQGVGNQGGGASLGLGLALEQQAQKIESGTSVSPTIYTVLDLLVMQESAGEVANVLNAFSPWGRGPAVAAYGNTQTFVDLVTLRPAMVCPAPTTVALGADIFKAPLVDAPPPVVDCPPAQAWVQVHGGVSTLSNDGIIGGFDGDSLGVAAGVEAHAAPGLTVGGALGYTRTEIDGEGGNHLDSATIDSVMPAVYAKYQPSALYAKVVGAGAFHKVDQTRVNPFVNEVYTADYTGAQAMVGGEIGFAWGLGAATVTPFVGAQYHHLWLNGYTESTAGDFGLTVDKQTHSFGLVDAGLRAQAMLGPVDVSGRVAWRHDFDGFDDRVMATFPGGVVFHTDVNASVGGLLAGARAGYDFGNFSVGLSYDALIGKDYTNQKAALDVGVRF